MLARFRVVWLITFAVFAATGCGSRPTTGDPIQDRKRIETSANAAEKIVASITREMRNTYGAKQVPTINVQVGDIVLVGFDEAIDAEEWGMRETNVEGGASVGKGMTPEQAKKLNQQQDPNDNRNTSRRVDIRKGGVVLYLSEDSAPITNPAGAKSPSSVKPVKP